jgi:hypothetical protein
VLLAVETWVMCGLLPRFSAAQWRPSASASGLGSVHGAPHGPVAVVLCWLLAGRCGLVVR